jgi:hypothetical protein
MASRPAPRSRKLLSRSGRFWKSSRLQTPAWLALMIGDTAYPIGDAQAALALAPQLQESVERLTQDCAYHGGEHANTPSDHH